MTLAQMFAEICRDYFPRWRNAVHWQVRAGSRAQWVEAQGDTRDTTEQGYCDSEKRTIWLSDPSKATLIHQICHAITGSGHDTRFWARMRQATQRAEALGETDLAAQLRREVETCEMYIVPTTASRVYRRVAEVVRNMPEISFSALVEYLAEEYGMTPHALCRRYLRLHQVYEAAKREWAC